MRNSTDPGNQMQWLHQELLDSEKINQKVYILGHIPMSDNTASTGWTSRF